MKVPFVTLAIVALALAQPQKQELYSDKYDSINVSEILANDRLRDQYYNCFVDAGPCITPDLKFFKRIVYEAIATECRKCTEKQKQFLTDISDWYTENQPEKFELLVKKLVEGAKKLNA